MLTAKFPLTLTSNTPFNYVTAKSLIPVLHTIYVAVTVYIVHVTPSIVTEVYPSTNPVPTIVMTASSSNLPDWGETVLTIGTTAAE